MHKSVKKILKLCNICQRAKQSILPSPTFEAIIPEHPGELAAIDLYGPLPPSRGGVTYLVVVLDVFSKFVALYTLKRATTAAILTHLQNRYFKEVGKPQKILSDCGTQFTAFR